MTIYDDIKKSIYESLFYNNQKDREIRLLKSFIYADLKLIVAVMEDKPTKKTVKQQTTEYYYGLYNTLTQSAIPQYSNEYQNIVDNMPKPTELLIDRTKEVQDLEKQERKIIEQFVVSSKVNPLYWSVLQDIMPHLLDQDTLNLYTFFLGNRVGKKTNPPKNKINVKTQNANTPKNEENKQVIAVDLTKKDNVVEQTTTVINQGETTVLDGDLDHSLSDTFYLSERGIDIQGIMFRPLKANELVTISLGPKELIQTVFQYKSSDSILDKFSKITNKKQTSPDKPTQEEIKSWPMQNNNQEQNQENNDENEDNYVEETQNNNQMLKLNSNANQNNKTKNDKNNKNNKKTKKEQYINEDEDEEDDESEHKVAIAIATVIAIALGLITSTILVGPWF